MGNKLNAKVKEEKSTRAETGVISDEIGRLAKLGWREGGSLDKAPKAPKLRVHVTLACYAQLYPVLYAHWPSAVCYLT